MTNNSDSNSEIDILGIVNTIKGYARKLVESYRILYVMVPCFIILGALLYIDSKPVYTAVAIIGPPLPSPTSAMLTSTGSGISLRSLARNGGNSSGPFQQFQQMLQSPQITADLAADDGYMSLLFYKAWDPDKKQWRRPGPLFNIIASIKRVLNRPVTDHPDAAALSKYLEKYFSVNQSATVGKSAVSNIMSSDSDYLTVSLEAYSPQVAEVALDKILNKADITIRGTQMRDVDARISYINKELQTMTQAEQRDALIQTLVYQEQLRSMLVADKRYSYVLVSRPYASPVPTKPSGPVNAILKSIFFALLTWMVLVIFEDKSKRVQQLLRLFRRSPA